MNTGLFCLCFVVLVSRATKREGVESMVTGEEEALLRAIKESGVINEMAEKLTAGAHSENEIPDKKSPFTPDERSMLMSFIEEYKADNKKQVSERLVVDIVERVLNLKLNKKPNLPQIFVQLGPVIDVLSLLEKKSKNVQKIIDGQSALFDSSASVKDILQKLTKNLKSELASLSTPKVPPTPKKKKTEAKPKGVLEILMQELMKNKNPMELLSLMNGDISSLSKVLGDVNYLEILQKVLEAYMDGSPYGPMMKQYLNMFLESEQGKTVTEGAGTFMESVALSESGQRLLKLAPQLMAVRDLSSLTEILDKEVVFNWNLFFEQFVNSDNKDEMVMNLAGMIVKAYNYVQDPPKNSPINQLPIILNGVLLSYKLPAYDSRQPAKSVSALLNKAMKVFSTYKVDTTPIINQLAAAYSGTMEKYLKDKSLFNLSDKKKQQVVTKIILAEVVGPAQLVWSAYSQASQDHHCAAKLLCQVNEEAKKEGSARQTVIRAASLAAGWTLSKASIGSWTNSKKTQDKFWSLQHAVEAGYKGADCSASYPDNNYCQLGRRTNPANHNEL